MITPASVIDDAPVRALGGKRHGQVSSPRIFTVWWRGRSHAESLNTCAVRVVEELGVKESYNYI